MAKVLNSYSKDTAKALVMALVAGLLGTGVALVGSVAPASAAACGSGSSSATYSGGDGTTSSTAFRISTSADLIRLSATSADWSGKFFIQTADIDLGGCEWVPIGNSTTVFTGEYNGGFYSITGLSISSSNTVTNLGLFGRISQTTIRDLKVVGSIASNSLGTNFIGGLVGEVPIGQTSIISKVRSEVDITTNHISYAGGIVGFMYHPSAIRYSSYSGNLVGSSNGSRWLGGITGWASSNNTHVHIQSSYARAVFSGPSQSKGGINGFNKPTLTKSYAATPGANFGITYDQVGEILSAGNLWDLELGSSRANDPSKSTITVSRAAGKTTSDMKNIATYQAASWDIVRGWEPFSDTGTLKIWGICSAVNDGYPFLLWEYTSDPCTSPPAPGPSGFSSGSSIAPPSSQVAEVSLGAGSASRQTLVRVRLTNVPAAYEQLFVVVRLLDMKGELIRELKVPVESTTGMVEIPVDKQLGQFNVVALTSNAAGATTAVSLNPQIVKQAAIKQPAASSSKRLLGKLLNREAVFAADSAVLTTEIRKTLRQAARLAIRDGSRLAITGFAANSPRGDGFEKRLAEKRALRVANFLRKAGFENWIYYHGLNSRQGSQFPGEPRRVEIRLLQ